MWGESYFTLQSIRCEAPRATTALSLRWTAVCCMPITSLLDKQGISKLNLYYKYSEARHGGGTKQMMFCDEKYFVLP